MLCDICGSANSIELICRCSSCSACQHVYCMLDNLQYVPDTWFCEGCASRSTSSGSLEDYHGVTSGPVEVAPADLEPCQTQLQSSQPPDTPDPEHENEHNSTSENDPMHISAPSECNYTDISHSFSSTPAQAPHLLENDSNEVRYEIKPHGDTFMPFHAIRDLGQSFRGLISAPYPTWKAVPRDVKLMWFRKFQQQVYWKTQYDRKVWNIFNIKGSRSYVSYMHSIRKMGRKPNSMDQRVYEGFLKYWSTPDFRAKQKRMRENCVEGRGGLGPVLNACGSISLAERKFRLAAAKGAEPDWLEVFKDGYQRKGKSGGFVDGKAERQIKEYERLLEEAARDLAGHGALAGKALSESQKLAIWTKVAGGARNGKVYGIGSESPIVHDLPKSCPTKINNATTPQVRDECLELKAQLQAEKQRCKQLEARILKTEAMMREMCSCLNLAV